MDLAGYLVLAAAIVAAAALLSRRGPDRATLDAVEGLGGSVQQALQHLQGEVVRVSRQQEAFQQDAARGREASVPQLAETARGALS